MQFAQQELQGLCGDQVFSRCAVLLIANKQDILNCMTPDEITDNIGF